MDIKDILSSLGLDFSNPEVKRGAMEAIEAILSSRTPIGGGDGGMGGGSNNTIDVELDPDLIQPSIKQATSGVDDDIEVEDEENILDQIKHNEPEEPTETTNSTGNDASSDNDPSSSEDQKEKSTSAPDEKDKKDDQPAKDDNDDNTETNTVSDTEKDSSSEEADNGDGQELDDNAEDDLNGTEAEDNAGEFEDDGVGQEDSDLGDDDSMEPDETAGATEVDDASSHEDDETPDDEDAELDFDEDDLLDGELRDSTEDEEIKTKHNARRIKRERTLAAAKKALEDARAKRVTPALIRELEKSIEALEALTEAVAKSLKDISDEEFNLLVNRVFDAIDACGDSGLTFTSDKERETQVKEIKDDISSVKTQTELSAEDVAKIRAETQAVKAKEKETAKYTQRARGSFKGFKEFLNSLYRAIALQVATEESRDDSWSAISRRNSGAGVLRQGQKVNELPNKKIPVIDFYFDQSGSWTEDDIKVGEKAVQSLADMESNGQIKVNIYYFSDDVSQNREDVAGGGTSAWNYIVKNIIATKANNVVIMTDDDMERMGRRGAGESDHLKYTVPGYVWYLWKNGENAPRLPRDLKGRGGVQQFSFGAGDM